MAKNHGLSFSPEGILAATRWDRPSGGAGAPAPVLPLPCLNSNSSNGTKGAKEAQSPLNSLQGNHKRSAFALGENVAGFFKMYGIENVEFLTLTFRDHVTDAKEGSRRFNSMATGVLKIHYRGWIAIMERQLSGRIHYHLLVASHQPVREGFDFRALAKANLRENERRAAMLRGDCAEAEELKRERQEWTAIYGASANPALRAEWAFWRKTAKAYGFGRAEILPIRKSEEAVKFYVSAYVRKHIENRHPEDKGKRLHRASQGHNKCTCRFMFHNANSRRWRLLLAAIGLDLGAQDIGHLGRMLGRRWCYRVDRVRVMVEEAGGGLNEILAGVAMLKEQNERRE